MLRSKQHIGWTLSVKRRCERVHVCVLLLQSIEGTCPCTLPVVFWPFVQSFPRKHKESIEQRLMASIASLSLQNWIFFLPCLRSFLQNPETAAKIESNTNQSFDQILFFEAESDQNGNIPCVCVFFCYSTGWKPRQNEKEPVLVLLCFSRLLFIHSDNSRPYVFPRMWR